MLTTSHADLLRWTLLGALGASLTFSCGGTAEESGGDGDGASGDGDGVTVGDGDGTSGDGDGTSGDGDGDGGAGIPACTNPVDLGGGFFSCDEGYTHRGEPSACPSDVPRAESQIDSSVCGADQGCCEFDADCTGANQYCQYSFVQVEGAWCTAGCLSDSDCGDGQICQCGDPMGQCVTAQCHSDEDCPGEARCASFATDEGCGPWTQFTCQTADDECASNADCEEGQECDGTGGVRQCVNQEFLCAIGRPFVVGDEIRVALLCERLDWALLQEPDLAGLDEKVRGALAQSWEAAAQMEHASVGAFARFSLQLLSLGAPAELIEKTNVALMDETRHARLCFGLASAYRGAAVGPAPLDIASALGDGSLEAILATTIIEGCCGETAAALEAAESAAHCEDQIVKKVLLQIAEEESAHAELSWRFVRWALGEHPELRGFVASQFGHLLREVSGASVTEAGPLARHGVLSDERRRSVRQEALAQVVAPCVQQLLAVAPAAVTVAPGALHA